MSPTHCHTIPGLCWGIRDALERWRSEQVDPPVSLGYHSRDVTGDIHPAGDPGGDRTTPRHPAGVGSPWERCEIHLFLPASSSCPRGCDAGGFGEGLRQGLSWDPSVTRLLRVSLSRDPPRVSRDFPASAPAPVLPCETWHREQKETGTLAWKPTRFRVSSQMERQISSIRTPRTLPAAAPSRSQTSDPSPALHITPEALVGPSRDREAGDASGAGAFGIFPPPLEVRDLFGSGCAAPEHPPGMSRAGLAVQVDRSSWEVPKNRAAALG